MKIEREYSKTHRDILERFVIRSRLIFWLLFFIMVWFAIWGVSIINNVVAPNAIEIVDYKASKDYSVILDETMVEMDLTFNWPCKGNVTVEFYDDEDNLLGKKQNHSVLMENIQHSCLTSMIFQGKLIVI